MFLADLPPQLLQSLEAYWIFYFEQSISIPLSSKFDIASPRTRAVKTALFQI